MPAVQRSDAVPRSRRPSRPPVLPVCRNVGLVCVSLP